jgi:hypothetical protein
VRTCMTSYDDVLNFVFCRDLMLIARVLKKPDVQKFETIVRLIFRFVFSFLAFLGDFPYNDFTVFFARTIICC